MAEGQSSATVAVWTVYLFLGVGTIASAVRRALPSLPAAGTTRVAPDQRFGSISPIAANDLPAISRGRAGSQRGGVISAR